MRHIFYCRIHKFRILLIEGVLMVALIASFGMLNLDVDKKTVVSIDVYSIRWNLHTLHVSQGKINKRSDVSHVEIKDSLSIDLLMRRIEGLESLKGEFLNDFAYYSSIPCDSRLDCEICYIDGTADTLSFGQSQYPFYNGKPYKHHPDLLSTLTTYIPVEYRPNIIYTQEILKKEFRITDSIFEARGLKPIYDSLYRAQLQNIEEILKK